MPSPGNDIITRYLGNFDAGQDLSAFQFHAVKFNMYGKWQLAQAGDAAQGVLVNEPLSGQVAKVAVSGVITCTAGAPIEPGRLLSVTTGGRVIEDLEGGFGWSVGRSNAAGNTLKIYVLGLNIGSGLPANIDAAHADALQTQVYPAASTVNALRAVRVDPMTGLLSHANSNDLNHSPGVVGIAITSVTGQNTPVQIVNQGPLEDPGFNFDTSAGQQLFLNGLGVISQTPPTTGFVQQVGFVTGPDSMYVDINQPIILC